MGGISYDFLGTGSVAGIALPTDNGCSCSPDKPLFAQVTAVNATSERGASACLRTRGAKGT